MRKIYFLFFTVFSFLTFSQIASAQLANTYIYTSSTGATLDPMAGATQILNSGNDDDPSALLNIGFTFNYEGVPYTQFSITPDGFIKLGGPVAVAQFGNGIVLATNIPKLFPYWDDLATGTTGSANFVVTGSAPNRICVIQWFITNPRNTTGPANTTFQAWLYESGRIDFRYGTGVGPSGSASIGIGGAVPTNFISITTPTNASSTTVANNANTVWPGSGTMYTFLPPPPCVAPPGGGTTQMTPAGSVCPGAPFTLSVTGASFGTGLTYMWETSPDGSAWTPSGVTTPTYATSITTNTYFRRKITCSGVDGWSTSLLVSVSGAAGIPFTEAFTTYATTFPPTCWTNNNTTYLFGQAVSGYGLGVGSAKFDFFNAGSGTNLDLGTSVFTAVPVNYRLTFDHAYSTYSGQVDQLQVLYSTNGGSSYTTLATYLGGAAGPLNTFGGTGATTAVFAPTAAQWATKAITLPVGTNKIVFRGVSAFGNNLFIDNVTVEPIPACLPPTGLTATAIATTTTTLNWTASASNPSGGYQWEVRTSGAGGSGATGLTTSGATAAGVVTANATTLTPNTVYNYYVRSNCGSGVFSAWAGPFAFQTACNAITSFPYTETFETASPTRSCWKVNDYVVGAIDWTYSPGAFGGNVLAAHGGALNAQFFQANYNGNTTRLVSPELNLSSMANGAQVKFWLAQQNWLGDQDEMRVYYKTSAAGPWTLVPGGTFTSSINQWTEIELPLPSSTGAPVYYVAFQALGNFGFGVVVDDVTIEAAPTCPKPTNVTATAVSPTQVNVTFTSPGSAFILEWGPTGYTPGVDNSAGAGASGFTFSTLSPMQATGLTPSTSYDFYLRRQCVPGPVGTGDYSVNVKTTATTLCPATNIPYLQNFESSVAPAPPTCTSVQDLNGNSGSVPNSGGGSWFTYDGVGNPQTYVSASKTIRYLYDAGDATRAADDWFYLQGLNLTAGITYRVKFFFKGSDGPTWTERFEVKYGTLANAASMTNLIYTNNSIATALANPFDSATADFTPATTGVYYIGFHATSLADQAFLYLDNVSVKLAPLVDVGVSTITLPNLTCPTNGVFLQATVKNYNTTAVNFATYPVTVTANITGAQTGTVSTILNTGTLAPGASTTIYLSPAFNFSTGGTYNITATTSTTPATNDPETGNDSYTTSVVVNPNPAVPTITPASLQLCLGNSGQLAVTTPAPTTASLTLTSTTAVPIPDNTAGGASSVLAVSGIPSTATITGISVTLNVTHTWVNDITVNLKSPNGSVLNLFNRKGAALEQNLANTVINSTSTTAIPATGAPFTGVYRPDAAIGVGPSADPSTAAGFANLYPSQFNGNWTLGLRDYAFLDDGTLTSWSITITYSYIPALTWTPITSLFTNSGATTVYTAGTSAYTVYVKPTVAGTVTYTATATGAGGCSATSTAVVTTSANPVITIGSIPDTVCISDPLIQLPASPVGGSWSGIGVSGNTFVPPATAVGTYTLTYSYTNAAGCTASSTKKIVVKDCPERIIRLSDNALFLYPNPNNGQFNIKINSVLYSYLNMKVFANNGVLVRTQQLTGLAWGRVVPIDLSNLPGGVYMVKFYYDGGARTSEKTFKVIIGHQ